jgi:hypothetical protein
MEESKERPLYVDSTKYYYQNKSTADWRGEYTRAQIAGRVLEQNTFVKVAEAIKNDKKGEFRAACEGVMQDLDPKFREGIIDDMWTAALASMRNKQQNKICW